MREESILAFWSGAVPRLVRLSLSGGIVFTMYVLLMVEVKMHTDRPQVRENHGDDGHLRSGTEDNLEQEIRTVMMTMEACGAVAVRDSKCIAFIDL